MVQSSQTADVCVRFSLLIKAMAADRDAVSVISSVSTTGIPLVKVFVDGKDQRRFMSRGAHVARCLRVLLDTIGEQHGVRYALHINGVAVEAGQMRRWPGKATQDAWAARGVVPAY